MERPRWEMLALRPSPREAPSSLLLLHATVEDTRAQPVNRLCAALAALALCHSLGDTGGAAQYEQTALSLVQEFRDDPGIMRNEFRVHWALALHAGRRDERVTAYWHWLRAVGALQRIYHPGDQEVRSHLFTACLLLLRACLRLGRSPEAQEALQTAVPYIESLDDQARWTLALVGLHRYEGRLAEAAKALRNLPAEPIAQWSGETRAWFHVTAAQVSADQSDLKAFQDHIKVAQQEAVANALDPLLSYINRVQRTPNLRDPWLD